MRRLSLVALLAALAFAASAQRNRIIVTDAVDAVFSAGDTLTLTLAGGAYSEGGLDTYSPAGAISPEPGEDYTVSVGVFAERYRDRNASYDVVVEGPFPPKRIVRDFAVDTLEDVTHPATTVSVRPDVANTPIRVSLICRRGRLRVETVNVVAIRLHRSDVAASGQAAGYTPIFGTVSAAGVGTYLGDPSRAVTVSRLATGVYEFTWASPLADDAYVVLVQPVEPATTDDDVPCRVAARTALGWLVRCGEQDNGGTPGVARDRALMWQALD